MGQSSSKSTPFNIIITISPKFKGKTPSEKSLQKFIKKKSWKDDLKFSLSDFFKLKKHYIKNKKIIIEGVLSNSSKKNKLINEVKDGFWKVTHSGDPIIINKSILLIKPSNIKFN